MADNERLERLAAQKKVLGEVAAWAQQTISFAIGLRARDSGKPFEGPDDIEPAFQETNALVDELWEKASTELGQDPPVQEAVEAYARKVFDWCYSHMNPES